MRQTEYIQFLNPKTPKFLNLFYSISKFENYIFFLNTV